MAQRTRSLASFTSVSANPTKVKLGNPFAKCTSTVTAGACNPKSARLLINASVINLLFLKGRPQCWAYQPNQAPDLCMKMWQSSDYCITLGISSSKEITFVDFNAGTDPAK